MIDGPNLYVYLNNNPINDIDPWGLCGGAGGGFWSGVKDWFEKTKEKVKNWLLKSLEIFVPGYGNYGGPYRTDSTFTIKPEDSMDKLFQQHDKDWSKGQISEANKILYNNLINLPSNPKDWAEKPNNIIGAYVYKELATDLFWWFNFFTDK